jgi:hypothetical protein
MMDAAALSAWASEALGIPIAFALERRPLPEEGLSEGERARYAGFSLPRRREDWLRGRAALKTLLRSLGEPEDTAGLAFPNARLSLSHSAGIAVAAGFRASPEGALGLGVDFEGRRPVKAATVRFYLSEAERSRPEAAALAESDLLRLWTVKEALYKADPGNRSRGWNLGAYEVAGSLADFAGSARVSGLLSFRYLSREVEEGFLSLAVSRGPAGGPVQNLF